MPPCHFKCTAKALLWACCLDPAVPFDPTVHFGCIADYGDISSLVQHLLRADDSTGAAGIDLFRTKSWMAQLGDSIVLVHKGSVVKQWTLSDEPVSEVRELLGC